jgi:hypothetical protein
MQFFYPYINSSILGSVKHPPILYFMSKYERKFTYTNVRSFSTLMYTLSWLKKPTRLIVRGE